MFSSSDKYVCQVRAQSQWLNLTEPRNDNGAIEYAMKMKKDNPNKAYRVVEWVEGKAGSNIYSC